jgi:hypothetical protein
VPPTRLWARRTLVFAASAEPFSAGFRAALATRLLGDHPHNAPVSALDILTDRWLIEALSQMSSNPRVRGAAAAWLTAHRTALELGFAEDDAQASADEALRREAKRQEHGRHSGESGGRTNGQPPRA